MNEVLTTNGSPLSAHVGVSAPNRRQPRRERPRSANGRRSVEPYDALLWRLLSRRKAGEAAACTIGLIGAEQRVGATTIAANLAVRAAELQQGPVLLVEANALRPKLAVAWKLAAAPRLAAVLAGEASLGDCVQDGPTLDLKVLAAADGAANEPQAWEPEVVDAFLAEAAGDYRIIVIDLPTAEQLNDALRLARQLEQVLLVVRAEHSRGPAAQRVAEQLADDGITLAGVVLSRQRSYVPRWLRRWV